jgi:hypothetical protein
VHEHDPRGSVDRVGRCRVGAAGPRIVEPRDHDVIERRCQPRSAVHEDSDPGALERAHDAPIVGPQVMIAEDGEATERRRDLREPWSERVDVPSVKEDEVPPQKEHVRPLRRQPVEGEVDGGRVSGRARMEVRRKADAQTAQMDGPTCRPNRVPQEQDAPLKADCAGDLRRPGASVARSEHGLHRTARQRVVGTAPFESHCPTNVAGGARISRSSERRPRSGERPGLHARDDRST